MDTQKTGTFLRILRKQKGLTQNQLAERIGVTDKAVSRWETGKGFPDVYLHAAALMGLKPQECVVFEDILKGINSARSAGFCTVGVYDRSSAADEAAIRRASMLYVGALSDPEIIKLFV